MDEKGKQRYLKYLSGGKQLLLNNEILRKFQELFKCLLCFFQDMAGLNEVEPFEIGFYFSLGTGEYLAC